MLTLLLFLFWLAVLVYEGWLITAFFVPGDRALRMSLALPLAAIVNALVLLVFTVLSVPLMLLTVGATHLGIVAIAWILRKKWGTPEQPHVPEISETWSRKKKIVGIVCSVLLANAFLFSAIHAVVLPSLSIDIFTNWTMRAKVSWADGAIAFDRTEERGVGKSQYPFLVHGLQITVNEGNTAWSDRSANTTTWLLTMSSFAAAFLMLRRMRGTFTALCALSAIMLIPMMTIHLSAGYGDIHLITYGLLAFLALALMLERDRAWLVPSALMVLGAVWSKSEGLYFVFVPWAFALLLLWWKRQIDLRTAAWTALPLVFFMPFLVLLIAKGLPLTPHESDGSLGIKWEGFAALPHALFGSGSFGVLWYVLPIAVIALLRKERSLSSLALLSMGIVSLLGILFVYLFTPNVGFLLNGQSFYRQMLLPAALLIAWCATAMKRTV